MSAAGDATVGTAGAALSVELRQLLDAAVERLLPLRRTFTEAEALGSVWEAGYEVTPAIEPRFVLAREAEARQPRQWRLRSQALANDRLLDRLGSGEWDGRELDRELERLSAEDGVPYVFCPIDGRFTVGADGTLERADRELDVPIPEVTRAELDRLREPLLAGWRAEGSGPWTVRQVTARLGELGWTGADAAESWLVVRSRLRGWADVARVGQDYWIPVVGVPSGPAETHLCVLPVLTPALESEAEDRESTAPGAVEMRDNDEAPVVLNGQVPVGSMVTQPVSWTVALRTVSLLQGFVAVPAAARGAYPPRAPGEGDQVVLKGLWFESGDALWLWLDRSHDRLHGPDLGEKLAWCEAGALLRVEWAPDVVVLRLVGQDEAVQREETRLVDVDALAGLRSGLGESYRRSLQAILTEAPSGLTFAELVEALRQRQGHEIHRGTVRALLSAGGFERVEGRWLAATDSRASARGVRAAVIATLVVPEETDRLARPPGDPKRLLVTANAIRNRLAVIGELLARAPDASTVEST